MSEHECFYCHKPIEFEANVFCPACWAAMSDDEAEMFRQAGII